MRTINTANIPDELKQRHSWVLWKYLYRQGKKTKVLYQTTGQEAKTNDPSTWNSFDGVLLQFNRGGWEGVGYVFSPEDPYTGIDLDGCRNPETGVIEQWAKDIVTQLGSYAELSPSMSGVKIWIRAKWGLPSGKNVKLEDMPTVCDKTPGIEVYDWGRFFTVTGAVLQGQRTITDRQAELDAIQERYFKPVVRTATHNEFRNQTSVMERARKYVAKMPPAVSGQNGSAAAFRVACVLVLGFGLSLDEAKEVMLDWNQTCQPPWSEREIDHKLEGADQKTGDRGFLRNVSPENWHRVDVPDYAQTEPKAKLNQPKPIDELHEVRETTMRDASKRYLQAVTSNKINLLELGLPDLDAALGGGVEAGEMIIFAARPSHGKSMAAQQVAHNFTKRGVPVLFVSEEMSALALGKRVIQFVSDVPNEHWRDRSQQVEQHIDTHFDKRAECYIVEGCRSALRVAAEIKRYAETKSIGLAIVDYAQLLKGVGKTRYEEVTSVSIALKQVAAECHIPLILLCQMSRVIEGRKPFVPVMSDLKESGQFEQDADVIIFQVWPHRLDSNEPYDKYQLFVAKNRNRPINTGVITCKFNPSRQMLTDDRGTNTIDELGGFSDDVMNVFDDRRGF